MASTVATETESLLDTVFAFVRGEFSDADYVHIHGVRVFSRGAGRDGERVEVRRGCLASSSDFISAVPLCLEVGCLFVPSCNLGWGDVHGEDAAHEGGRNSGREVVDKDILVGDTSESDAVLERGDIGVEGWFMTLGLSIKSHAFCGKPGNGVVDSVVVFKGFLELIDEFVEDPEGDGGSGNGILPESVCPSKGRAFGHV